MAPKCWAMCGTRQLTCTQYTPGAESWRRRYADPTLTLCCCARNVCRLLSDVFSSGRGAFNYVRICASAPWPSRCGHQVLPIESGTRMVLTGGTKQYADNGGTYYNDVWLSNVGGSLWTQITAATSWANRASFGAVSLAERLYVFGGFYRTTSGNNEVELGDRQLPTHTR